MKRIVALLIVCLSCLCSPSARAQRSASSKLNPMEAFVCAVDKHYAIVRNDETRRNVYTLRHLKTLKPAFDVSFEKYLESFELDGMPFIAVANWNPAFGYVWSAWVLKGRHWVKLLDARFSDMTLVEEGGKPICIRCINMDGRQETFMVNKLLRDIRK